MASVNLSGTLTNPEGEPDEGSIVKFTLLTTTGTTISSSKSQLEVPQDGLYDIDIVYGNLRVDYINEDGTTRFVAIVTVNGDTVATSLPELLNASVPPTDSQLLEFQAILAACIAAQAAAEAAETGAVAAKDIAVAASIIKYQTFAELEAISETVDYKQFTVAERANAAYTLQPLGYSALAGDATLANGRVAKLQVSGTAKLEWFGAKQDAESLLDSATDDLAACNSAALRMSQEGGGTVSMSGLAALSGTLVIPQRVIFAGTSQFFANQFTNTAVRPSGCGFYALVGINDNIIDLKLDIYNDGGTLRETINDKELNDYRYFGGLKNLIVYGNRSNTANPPSIVDKNTSGSGIICSGVRYPILDGVTSMMCAEDGLETISFDYGLGSNACNNMEFDRVVCLSNAENGATLSGGDTIIRDIIAGYNGNVGVLSTSGSGLITGVCWNNQLDGLQISGGKRMVYDFSCYDNKRQGWRITGTKGVTCRGSANSNGRDTGQSSSQRSGVLVGDSNEGLQLAINSDGGDGVTDYQAYGFNITNATYPIDLTGSSGTNNFTATWLISDIANVILHSDLPEGASHSGFSSTGDIIMSDNRVETVRAISFNIWATKTPTAGTLSIGANSLVNINNGDGETINDIVGGGTGLLSVVIRVTVPSVTFVNLSSKLRLNGGANKVVSNNESISFVYISGDVWQEV